MFQNTLAQDLAWDRWEKCRDVGATVVLKEIRPDGQIWVTYSAPHGAAAWRQCDREVAQAQAARGTTAMSSSAVSISSGGAGTAARGPIIAPTWKRGDEWAYRWEGAEGKGTYVWSLDREEAIDNVPHYVIRTGTREIFYRKADIAFTRETVDGALVVQYTPARLRYVWPLEIGKTWQQAMHEERPVARQTSDREDVVSVEGEEAVTVPAGTFQTLKLVYRTKGTNAIRYEEWYSPELKAPVRLHERLSSGLRVRELIAYKLR
jgi:hypothetical protein